MSRRDAALTSKLSAWFAANRRGLPWRTGYATGKPKARPRAARDPWLALIAEVMLQQTQVSRVMEYYGRFAARFPTPAHMAAADEQEVLALWSGLGYYRRARLLKACADAIVRDHGRQVPSDAQALLTLPGVGRYTAGAISSIVFGAREPICDGNVSRVLQRLDLPAAGSAKETERWLWQRAGELVARADDPAIFNEGLMELGALVCTPKAPKCEDCPLRRHCRALAEGVQRQVPPPKVKAAQKDWHQRVRLVTDVSAAHVLLHQRPARGLWASMWQPPTVEGPTMPTAGQLDALCLLLLGSRGKDRASPALAGTFEHQTTHRKVSVTVERHTAFPKARPAELASGGVWKPTGVVLGGHAGLSNAALKAVRLALGQDGGTH